MAFHGLLQRLFRILPGIGPLLILVTSECGALSCLLGLLHGQAVGGFAVEPRLWRPQLISSKCDCATPAAPAQANFLGLSPSSHALQLLKAGACRGRDAREGQQFPVGTRAHFLQRRKFARVPAHDLYVAGWDGDEHKRALTHTVIASLNSLETLSMVMFAESSSPLSFLRSSSNLEIMMSFFWHSADSPPPASPPSGSRREHASEPM